jgi:hypothetical protein
MISATEENGAPHAMQIAAGNTNSPSLNGEMLDKVVIQYGGRIAKGFTNRALWPSEQDLSPNLSSVPVRLHDSNEIQEIPLDGVKAVFFVKTFEGKSHDDLRFHDHLPPVECLWVRVTFDDGEVIEGLIRNSGSYVLQDGFFMSPIDPEGNNVLVYVIKAKLQDIEVLGLRAAPKSFPSQ